MEIADGDGKRRVTVNSVLGNGEYGLVNPLPRDFAAGSAVTFITDKVYVVPNGVDVANKRITIDQVPEALGLQGTQVPGPPVELFAAPRARNGQSLFINRKIRGQAGRKFPCRSRTASTKTSRSPRSQQELLFKRRGRRPPLGRINPRRTSKLLKRAFIQAARQISTSQSWHRRRTETCCSSPAIANPIFKSALMQLHSFFGRHFVGIDEGSGFVWEHMVGRRTSADLDQNLTFTDPTAPHADARDFVVTANGTFLAANDGGIARFTPGVLFEADITHPDRPNLGTWTSVNGTLGVVQFYDVDYDPVRDSIIGGSQDNGTAEETGSLLNFREVDGGDGIIVQVVSVPHNAAPTVSFRYFTSQNFDISRQVALGPGVPGAKEDLTILNEAGNVITSGFDFVQVYAVNETDSTRILVERSDGNLIELQYGFNVAQNENVLQIVRTHSRDTLQTSGRDLTSAIYGFIPPDSTGFNDAKNRGDLIYAGFDNGKLFFREKVTAGNAAVKRLANYQGSSIRDIAIDPFDFRRVIIVDDQGRVWSSADAPGGASFRSIGEGLKIISKGDTRTVEFINRTGNPGDEILLVGGLGGVFQYSGDPFSGNHDWFKFGANLPKVEVTDLHYDRADDILVAGTWGRGAWSIKNFSTQRNVFPTAGGATAGDLAAGSAIPEQTATAGFVIEVQGSPENDELIVRRNQLNPQLLELVSNGQILDVGGPIELVTVTQIVFDGLAGDDRLIVDVSNGVIGLPGSSLAAGDASVVFRGGSGIDTIELKGGPVTTSATNYSAASKTGTFVLASDDAIGEYHVTDVEMVEQSQLAATTANRLNALGAGLEHLADWSGQLLDAVASPIAALGNTWVDFLNGLTVEADDQPLGEPPPEATAVKGTIGISTSEILRRLFETGPDGLGFLEIRSLLANTTELVTRLDALGDVTVVQDDANGLVLDVQIQRRLEGQAALAVEVLDGKVSLEGDVVVSGEVTAKLRLGVDARGFYFDADVFGEPEIVIRDLAVAGDVKAIGKVGFLGVTLDAATLEIDPGVAINIDIRDPGADPLVGDQDGVVRVYELATDPMTMASAQIVGNSQADDVVLRSQFERPAAVRWLGTAI